MSAASISVTPTEFSDPEVQTMVEEVQQYYAELYGGSGDQSPTAAEHFTPPGGRFFTITVDGNVAGMGGWRRLSPTQVTSLPWSSVAEIKRMYIRPSFRGHGLSRIILDTVERTAAADGIQALVLETGSRQVDALGLYRSSGYEPVDGTGWSFYDRVQGAQHLGRTLHGET